MRKTAITTLLVFLLLLPAADAGATLIERDRGTTTFTLTKGFKARLNRAGIGLASFRPGKLLGPVLTLPIRGGQIEGAGIGVVTMRGGLRLRAGEHAVTVEGFGLSTRERGLGGSIGGEPVPFIGTVDPPRATRDAFDIAIASGALRLTGRAARLLNRELELSGLFKAGQALFRVNVNAKLQSVKAAGGLIELTLDQGLAAKLSSLGVLVRPFESATVNAASPPTFFMPIEGGAIGRDLTRGNIFSAEGLRLIGSGEHQLVLAGIDISFDAKTASAGVNVQPSGVDTSEPLAAVDFSGSPVRVGLRADTLTVPARDATLSPQVAERLNEVLAAPLGKSPVFYAGEPLGTLSFTAQTQ